MQGFAFNLETSDTVSERSTEELLAHSDAAMYSAKRGGKNRYVVYATPVASP